MTETLKDRLLNTLIESKQLKKQDIDAAMELQKKKGIGLDKALIEKGLINEKELLGLLVNELGIPFINLSKYKIDPALQEVIPEKIARQYHIIPLSLLDNMMTVALSDPLNIFVIDNLKNITGKNIDVVLSTSTEIMKAIETYYGAQALASVKEISQDIAADEFEIVSDQESSEDLEGAFDKSEKAPIVRMVNLVIKEALKQRASDIHLEPMEDGMRVRYRIDGVLQEIHTIPKVNQNAVIVRIKIMARIDITTVHIPQDGRFKLKLGGKEVDFRVSMLPTTFGQKVVMRVLDKKNLSVGLEGLGFSTAQFQVLKEGIKAPFGMILVTGPTGSGKSTTLYSILNELNTVDRNIITVEDPVEYLLDGLTQIHTRAEIGLTFAEGLRAMLRQSPDVVMVGEIRDNETADIAIKASLTGQLVLATLHTNDAAGALTRLVDMDVEAFLVASSLVLVSAQRLCRKICPHCKEEEQIAKKALEEIKHDFRASQKFYHGKGCDKCRQTGYLGRTCVTEVLEMDDDIRIKLISGSSSDEIKEYARKKKSMVTLWEDAMAKCLAGETTLEEVLRVTTSE